jgi:hypothetical protein
MKKILMAIALVGCASLSPIDDEDDPELYPVCKMVCERKYHNVYGIQYRRIKKDLVFCKCLRPNGDKVIYTNIDQSEVETNVEVELVP